MKRLLAFLAILFLTGSALAQGAPDPRDAAPLSLIVTYKVAPADRAAMRAIMAGEGVRKLDALRAQHRMAGYRLLWGRYADDSNFDVLLALDFDGATPLANWRTVEEAGGALPATALRLVKSVVSSPADTLRCFHGAANATPTYLIISYDYLIAADDYIKYVDGYIVPQMRGWIDANVLGGYDVQLARFAAARPWSSMLMLEYRGDEGLGRRDATTRAVRRQLASVPAWKAFADNKAEVREVRGYAVADVLAAR